MSFEIFDTKIDYEKARQIVNAVGHKDFKDNIRMYKGDMWGERGGGSGVNSIDGDFWVGPHADYHPNLSTQIRKELKALFVSRNVIKEIIDRHIDGVQIHFSITVDRPLADGEGPTEEEVARIEERETLVNGWLEKRMKPIDNEDRDDIHPIHRALANVLMDSRAMVRLFVPRDKLVAELDRDSLEPTGRQILPASTMEECLDRIYVHTPDPNQTRMWTWKDSQEQIGLFHDVDRDEFTLIGTATSQHDGYAEMTYLDDDGNTILRIVSQDQEKEGRAVLDLGGRLTMHEVRRPILITDQIRSMQKSLNMAMTMMSRNVVLGGFVERTLLNGQLPGRWDKEKQPDGTEKEVFKAEPIQLGAASMNQFAGIEYVQSRNADGSVTKAVTDPQMVYRDPVPVQTFKDTKEILYAAMLEECHQLHYLLSDKATTSGEARKQAVQAFIMDLDKTITAINRLYAWMIDTVLRMAAFFADADGYMDGLKVDARSTIDVGRLGPDDLRIVSELVEREHLSLETGLTWMGVADTQAEMERIEREKETRAAEQPDLGELDTEINDILAGRIPNEDDEEPDDDDQGDGENDDDDTPTANRNGTARVATR